MIWGHPNHAVISTYYAAFAPLPTRTHKNRHIGTMHSHMGRFLAIWPTTLGVDTFFFGRPLVLADIPGREPKKKLPLSAFCVFFVTEWSERVDSHRSIDLDRWLDSWGYKYLTTFELLVDAYKSRYMSPKVFTGAVFCTR